MSTPSELRPLWMGMMYEKRIMIVVSDEIFTSAVSDYLQVHGWNTAITDDLSDVLILDPDLVILDEHEFGAWELMHKPRPDVPIVIIYEHEVPSCYSNHPHFYLKRPLDPNALYRLVHCLAVQDLNRSLFLEQREFDGEG